MLPANVDIVDVVVAQESGSIDEHAPKIFRIVAHRASYNAFSQAPAAVSMERRCPTDLAGGRIVRYPCSQLYMVF